MKIAINGFGRIGRLAFRIFLDHPDMQVVAINDVVSAENLAYLMKYDTVHGRYPGEIRAEGDRLVVGSRTVPVFSIKDPSTLPWNDLGIDYVIESTGLFTTRDKAKSHLDAGAKRVILSAPAKSPDVPTFVMGVNEEKYDPKSDTIVSMASCTTNGLAPVTKVLCDRFGLKEGLMTTIHALTATQATVDAPSKKDWRSGRAAGYNIIPASTGAAKAVGLCIPEVQGKLTGMAFRVPVMDVSVVDLTVSLEKKTSYQEICSAMQEASSGRMKGILGYTDEDVVSSDFIGSSFSSIFDAKAGIEMSDTFFKLVSWYDNEWGYATRIVDFTNYLANKE